MLSCVLLSFVMLIGSTGALLCKNNLEGLSILLAKISIYHVFIR